LQVFIVRQERSWTTLNVSKRLFKDLMEALAIFSAFWECMFTFGTKDEEHECVFPGFSLRSSSSMPGKDTLASYVLRRAELNHRKLEEGQIPWSIRQTAVYHRLDRQSGTLPLFSFPSNEQRSSFVLISPSKRVDERVGQLLKQAQSDRRARTPGVWHSLLVSDSIKGWQGYIAWLEEDVKARSDQITFAPVGYPKGDGFRFSVEDRQALKVVEDSIIDLQIILSTLMENILGIRSYCRRCCGIYCGKESGNDCGCKSVADEFDQYASEVSLFLTRASILRSRVISIQNLVLRLIPRLSDLLRYEDQRALKDLTLQSQEEACTMRSLTEKTTEDAAAVKVLTIIGVIFLPTTFVANIFSTEFVRTDDNGHVVASANSWLLAAIALPLTFLTVVTWWLCVRYHHISALQRSLRYFFARLWGWIKWMRWWNKTRVPDIENRECQTKTGTTVSMRTLSRKSTAPEAK
ncbi:uncharacterized protein K452DRAFT_239282, partial [Aplosporella prunicola CBS 121167]